MAKKSKKFVVATEGATVDGRTIEPNWITQMAANYSPAKYTAGVNIEHIRSALPDSPFKNYGTVTGLSAQKNSEGKLQLLATIAPTPALISLAASGQKLFTSIEVNPKFADTGEAYLVGLAVTDTPASLGTDMLAFTASNPDGSPLTKRKQQPDNHFSAALETAFQFEEDAEPPSILEKLRKTFKRKAASDEQRFSDVETAIEELAEHGQVQSQQTADALRQVEASVKANQTVSDAIDLRVKALEDAFAKTADPTAPHRPIVAGNGQVLTDF